MEILISTITSSSVVIIITFLARNLIIERLKNAVKHEYDSKITTLRADLESKQRDIEAIRSGTLNSISQRQGILYQRQLQAAERLWEAVLDLAPAKAMSMALEPINYDNALKAVAKDEQARKMFEILSPLDINQLKINTAQKERPFLSPLAWAYYSAYEAIVTHAAVRMHMLKKGIDFKKVVETEHVKKLIKTALPAHSEYVDKYGVEGFHYLLDLLERNILDSISEMLDGNESDLASIQKAAEITKRAEELSHSPVDA